MREKVKVLEQLAEVAQFFVMRRQAQGLPLSARDTWWIEQSSPPPNSPG